LQPRYNFNNNTDCKTNATLAIKFEMFANTLLYMVLLQLQIKKATSLLT